MSTAVLVLTTVGADDDPHRIGRSLVDERLAACVNIIQPIRSIYRWEGRVTEEGEQLLLIKTVRERLDELKEALLSTHPYEVPEFIVIDIDAVEGPYRQWLIDATKTM